MGYCGCGGQQVAGADAGGQQGLVGVTEGGVGNQHFLGVAYSLGEPFGAQFEQALTPACRGLVGRSVEG